MKVVILLVGLGIGLYGYACSKPIDKATLECAKKASKARFFEVVKC